jgi:hypothetical protein
MDKRHKTRWERQMNKLIITLIIVLPIVFGLVFWLIARMGRVGP